MNKEQEIPSSEGVAIPKDAIENSEEKKRRSRTMRQLPVYRDMANMKYLIVSIAGRGPRKYAKYYDEMVITASDAKKTLALALTLRDNQSRCDNLDYARTMMEDLQDDMMILHRLEVIGKTEKKKVRKLAQGIIAQLVALRDYTRSQGIDINGKTYENELSRTA